MTESVGSVDLLRRYPVKSMLGEELRAADVTERGLPGDRALALVHSETSKVVSAKNPRLWRGMLKLAAMFGPDVKINFPDGTSMTSTDPGIDAALPRDTDALRVPAAHNRIRPAHDWHPAPCVGVYGQVIRPGRIELGDEVRLRAGD